MPQSAGFSPGQEAQGYTDANNRVKFGSPITISQPGYIYVWVSNESEATKVWFDDLTVVHRKDIVSQATDYETWGGILREQKYNPDEEYRYGYQGKYAEKDEETGWYSYELRMYSPELGRWTTKDPAGQYFSTYVGMGNNPVSMVDPDGAYSKFGASWRNFFNGGNGIYESGGEWGYNTNIGGGNAGIVSHFGDENKYFLDFQNSLKLKGSSWTDWAAVGVDAGDDVMKQVGQNFQVLQKEANSLKAGINFGKEIGKVNTATTTLKWAGRGLAVYNANEIESKYRDGKIGASTRILEQGTNVYSVFGGIHGAAWGIGWEIGRAITTVPSYQSWKQNTFLPWRSRTLKY